MTNYSSLMLYSFAAAFILLFLWETLRPWSKSIHSMPVRWWNTLGLYVINRYTIIWLLPIATLPAAMYAQENNLGINLLDLNPVVSIIIATLLYDLFHYWVHRILHTVPILWRLHRVHHSDPDMDVSVEFKHHPLEGLLAGLLSIGFIILAGIHPLAIILRLMGAQIVSLASHANIKLPEVLDQRLRLIIVTPSMHRIHHSSWQPETDSNYGVLFSFWDRLFKSYVANPANGFEHMQLGLDEFRSSRDLWLDRLLIQPFISVRSNRPDNRDPIDQT